MAESISAPPQAAAAAAASPDRLFTTNFVAQLVSMTTFGLSFSAFFLLPKFFAIELGADEVQIGAVSAVGAVAGVIAFPIVGSLNDVHGRVVFIRAGSLLMALSALGMFAVHDMGVLLYCLRIVHSVAFAMVFNSSTTLVSHAVRPERLGHALGVFGIAMLVTNASAPAVAEWMVDVWGWRSVFGTSVAFGVLAAVTSLAIRDSAPPARTATGAPRPSAGALVLLKEPRARRIVSLIAVAGAAFGTLFIFHQPFALSLGMTHVSGFFLTYAVAAILVRVFFSGLADRLGRQRVSAWALTFYGAAVIGTAWLRPGMLEVIGTAMGLAHGVFYPSFNALAIESVGPEQRGSMMSLYHGGFNAGMAVALLGAGFVVQAFGYPALFIAVGSFAMLASLRLATGKL